MPEMYKQPNKSKYNEVKQLLHATANQGHAEEVGYRQCMAWLMNLIVTVGTSE